MAFQLLQASETESRLDNRWWLVVGRWSTIRRFLSRNCSRFGLRECQDKQQSAVVHTDYRDSFTQQALQEA